MFCVCLTLFAMAADPVGAQFALHSAATESHRGRLQAIERDWSVRFGDAKVPGADLVSLRRTDLRLPPYPTGAQVIFANGDRIPGDVLAIEDDRVRFRAILADASRRDRAAPELTIPLSAVAEIWFQPPPESDAARPKAGERRRRDVVYLSNGDTRTGTVVGMKSRTQPLILKEEVKETQIDPLRITALAMN